MWDFKKFQDYIAIIDEYGTKVTYREIGAIEEKIQDVIGKRALVVSLCQNSIGSVVGYLSFLNARIVPIMLNAHLEQELLVNLLSTYLPEYLWVPLDMVTSGQVEDVLKAVKENEKSKTDGATRKTKENIQIIYSVYDYSLIQTGFEKKYELYPELGLLLTTSGSTGSPKFVRQSYDNIRANAKSIVEYLKLDETERPITTLPMNYTYGLSIINSHAMVGATLLVTEKSLMQKEFWAFFKEEKATSFGGVPYTYEILDKLRFMRMELPTLRTMTQAGGKLTPELHAKFAAYAKEKGKNFVVMYGQCEATARMGYLPADMAVEKCGSMGIAIPGGKFVLMDADGEEIQEPHVTGELVYEGANVTLGYAECGKDLAKGDERKGLLQTGDMAQFDEDGYYYIVGRKKRFLKIYGNRVNLDEMDRMIKGAFDELECACAGVDDHMYIFLTEEAKAKAKAEEVKAFVAHKTGLNPVAFRVIIVKEIPKNDAGKVLYRELEKFYKS